MNFKEFIENDRENHNSEKFEGTFLDYLELVRKNPDIVKLAHKRIYDMIIEQGVEVLKPEDNPKIKKIYGNEKIKRYNFFKDDFFGIDKVIMKLMNYMYSASMKGEEARQVLYLVGPVGAGKSSLVESIKKLLEVAPPIYAIKGCPMHEEPLHLIPKHLRKKFEDNLGVQIEGDLCPVCKYRLLHEYDGRYEEMPVVSTDFSIRSRKGVGVVPPVDPNNQDTSILTGSIDISKMDMYPEDDPRIFSLNGAFNVGNRGLVEFIEVFKNDVEYLHTIITATQEKSIPSPGKGSMIYFDGLIIAHSNEAEWNKFKSDHTNEAILDRIVKIEVPYCLESSAEQKIYEKILKKSNFNAHIAPHTIEIAAMFATLSRLAPSMKVDPVTKLRIYNGEDIVEKGSTKKIDIGELREEAEAKVKGKSDLVFEAPTDLVKEEKEVYLFLVNELKELNIINNLDIELLKMTSNAVVELRKARVNVRKYGQLIQKPDGSLQKNPAITILRDYESIFNRCCRELCLSPQSRMALSKMMADIQANSEDELLKILSE